MQQIAVHKTSRERHPRIPQFPGLAVAGSFGGLDALRDTGNSIDCSLLFTTLYLSCTKAAWIFILLLMVEKEIRGWTNNHLLSMKPCEKWDILYINRWRIPSHQQYHLGRDGDGWIHTTSKSWRNGSSLKMHGFSVFPAKAISGISFWVPFFVKVKHLKFWEGILWGVFQGFLLANIISAWKMEVGCRILLLLELQNFWNPNSRPIHRWILRVSSDGRNPVNQLRLVVLSHYL